MRDTRQARKPAASDNQAHKGMKAKKGSAHDHKDVFQRVSLRNHDNIAQITCEVMAVNNG